MRCCVMRVVKDTGGTLQLVQLAQGYLLLMLCSTVQHLHLIDQWKLLKRCFKGMKGPLGSSIGTFGQILNGVWSDFANNSNF